MRRLTPRLTPRLTLLLILLATPFFPAPPTSAQFIASPFSAGTFSGFNAGSQIPRPLYFQRRLSSSQYRSGPFFFKPYLGLRDAAIVSNFGGPLNNLNFDDPTLDLTISAGAGVRAYVSPYRRSILAAHAMPQYNWFLDNRDQRRLTGSFGLGSFNYFGRLGLEVSQRRIMSQGFFAADAPVITTSQRDIGRVAAEYRLWRNLRLVTTFTRREFDTQDDRDGFDVLDRSADEVKFGVVYQMPRDINIALQRIETDVEFGSLTRNLSSNRTTNEFQFNIAFHRVGFSLVLQDRKLTATRDSRVRSSTRTLGRIALPITPRTGTAFTPYVLRNVTDAATGNFSEIVQQRVGLAFQGKYKDYVSLRIATEYGSDEYVPFIDSNVTRQDDVFTLGGRLSLTLPRLERWVVPSIRFVRTEFTSNIPGASRVVSTFSFSFEIPWPWIPSRLELPWEKLAWGDTGGAGW